MGPLRDSANPRPTTTREKRRSRLVVAVELNDFSVTDIHRIDRHHSRAVGRVLSYSIGFSLVIWNVGG
jgi:hypothetical protein